MSLFLPVQARCTKCATQVTADLAASVNADRRPDLRDAILDGSFQSLACPSCGTNIRMPAHLTFIDMDRGQWILVEDAAKLMQWHAVEAEADALYSQSFGRAAPPLQRQIGETMSARLVFGWAALREKLVARDAGLDDVTLELFKISVLRNVPAPPLADMTELRLIEATDGALTLRWLNAATEEGIADLPLERALYDALAANPAPWAALRAEVTAGLFVDMKRILLARADGSAGKIAA